MFYTDEQNTTIQYHCPKCHPGPFYSCLCTHQCYGSSYKSLGYRLFHISSSTFSFHKGTVTLSCTCIATFRSCKMFDRSDTVFFCLFVNKVTATSHHAISTLDCHRHINLRKISSMQFPEPVDFLDASQTDPDGMAIKGSKVKTFKLFDSKKSHICHAICKYLVR